jgi:hypothetical protein
LIKDKYKITVWEDLLVDNTGSHTPADEFYFFHGYATGNIGEVTLYLPCD